MDEPVEIALLLIEDDEDDYFLAVDTLEAITTRNYKVTWADNAEAGMAELRSGKHDVCLVDYRLGAITGVELLESCREALRATPAIVLTGAHSSEVDDASSRAGASDYLVKGELTPDTLERAVRYAMQRKASDARIEYLAFHDPLTDLPNRVLFGDRVSQALARTARTDDEVFVIFFDLDNFKDINDTRGHAAGDLLLTQVTNRIRGILRPNDTIARLGGDEFGICIEGPPDDDRACELIERIRSVLTPAFDVDSGASIVITASFGVASTTETSTDPEELLRNADIAMYQAKHTGKNTFAQYERSMHDTLQRRIALENDLRDAIRNGEIDAFFQPFVDLTHGVVVGFEALARWDHPELGPQSPAEFIEIAERSGLIIELGQSILHKAAESATKWRADHGFTGFVSVNVSPHQIADAGFVDRLNQVIDSSAISPGSLMIEFTESIMTEDVDYIIGVLDKISELGCGIALDDFGTGYSSLSNVHLLPISTLKVDRSFVVRHADVKGLSMLRTIAIMSSSLGLASIAEGIETESQFTSLRSLGFSMGQGFLFSPAVPADVVPELLDRRFTFDT